MSHSPRNTAAEDPLMYLLGAMDARNRTGNPTDFIVEQESAGQRQLVASEVLPAKMRCREGDAKAILEASGVKFLGLVDGDEMFQRVELPNGWRKEATGHSMWSTLFDDKGRERASIFYKAAFYDRDAFMNVNDVVG